MDITIDFELEDNVSDQSKFSLANQLQEVIERAIQEKEIELPDGEIVDFAVQYDPELHF